MKVMSDQDIIKLLSNLNKSGVPYPPDLLAARRVTFMKQAAQLANVLKPATQSPKGRGPKSLPPSTGALLETVLIVAIVAEAGTAAYVYRARLTDLIKSFSQSPHVADTTVPHPSIATHTIQPVIIFGESLTPIINTPTPFTLETPQLSDDNNGNNQADATPIPDKGNNGLHLGQTKVPDPQNGGNNSGGNNDQGGDKKPKDKGNPNK